MHTTFPQTLTQAAADSSSRSSADGPTADTDCSSLRVGVLVGSLSSTSINRTLARSLATLIGERAAVAEIEIGDLPLYNADLDDTPPDPVRRFKRDVLAADGLIIVTPEYNRTISAALKNAFEWGSRPYGESIWTGIPAGLVGTSPGAIGTATAQQHARNVMSFLDMPTLAQPEVYLQFRPEVFAADGHVVDAGTRGFLAEWTDRFVAHVRLHAAASARSGEGRTS